MNDFREYSELYHYGIKGMHWGIRRYQNKDGSLTAEGRARAKLEKQQEIDAIKEHYRNKIEKNQKKISNAEYKIKIGKKVDKNKYKKQLNQAEINTYKAFAKKEIEKINKMSWSELSKARRQKQGAHAAISMIGTAGLTAMMAAMTGIPVPLIFTTYPDLSYLNFNERSKIVNKNMSKALKGQRDAEYIKRNMSVNGANRFMVKKHKKKI